MAIELIDQYVDRAAFANDTEFIKAQIKEAMDAYLKLSNTKVGVSGANTSKEVASALKQVNAELDRTAKLSDRAAVTSLKLAKAQKEEAAARKNNAQAAQAEARAAEVINKTKASEEKASVRVSNANREQVRAYKSLQREYVILRKVAEDYGARLGVESKQYQEAAKRAGELNDKLKAIDGGIGNFQRNVGNYQSGFNGLSNSVNQITRELPAFSNSVQTGFLAISNNLPIFFDEISRARAELTRLRAAGEQVPTLAQQLGRSFFTMGTALSLGVTALTIFGPQLVDFVASLFKGKEALDKFAESQRVLGEAFKDNGVIDAVASVNELRINIDLARKGLIDKEGVVKQYNESIGKTTGEVKSLDEAERGLIKNGDAYVKMMLYKAAAQLALQDAAKKALQAEQDRIKAEKEFLTTGDALTSFGAGNVATPGFVPNLNRQAERDEARFRAEQGKRRKDAAVKQSEDEAKTLTDIATEFQKKAADISSGFKFDFFGGDGKGKGSADEIKQFRNQLFQDEQKDFQKQLEALSNSEQLSLNARQDFRKKANQQQIEIIQEAAGYEIAAERDKLNAVLGDAQSSKNAKINAQNEFNTAVADINQKAGFEIKQANKQLESDLIKIKADSLEAQKKQYEDEYKELVANNKKKEDEAQRSRDFIRDLEGEKIANNEAQALAILDAEFATIDRKRKDFAQLERNYQLRRLQIQEEYQIKALQSQITFAEQQIAIDKERTLASGDTEAYNRIKMAEEKLYGLKIKLSQAAADFQIKKNKAVEDNTKASLDNQLKKYREARDLFLSFGQVFADLANIGNEKQKNQIQEEIDLIEKKKAAEIEAINASTLAEEEKANKIKIIEARTAAQREQLELRQRQLEQRKAQYQKAISIATIIASTAEAVLAALGSKPYTPANIGLAAAAGALGAAQLAVVLATPVPKYAKGTDDHPGGYMVVGDGGKREIVVEPSGNTYVTPDTDTLMTAPRGTMVFPDIMAYQNALYKSAPELPSDAVDNRLQLALMKNQVEQLKGLRADLKKQPAPASGGRVRYGRDYVKYINQQVFN